MNVRFNRSKDVGFYKELQSKVNQYFIENNISKNANGLMAFKVGLFLSLLVAFYLIIILELVNPWMMLIAAILMGATTAFIGFNVGHDAIHGSMSSKKWVNRVFSMAFNLVGANAYMWDIMHNKVHHTFTNIPGHDEDLEAAPGLIRLSPKDEYKEVMRFQHIYAFALYSLTSLSWVLRKDYVKFFADKIGQYETQGHPTSAYVGLFFWKAVYYTLFIVFPLVFIDSITWWQFIIGFVAMHMAEGLTLGLVFQLAHVVEGLEYPEPDETGTVEESWAVHQMYTTADFARNNPLVTFLCGGLNFQIEHHLFPHVCHVHYPAISKIVEEVAHEHNVPYLENKTFGKALKSHYSILKELGKPHPTLKHMKVA